MRKFVCFLLAALMLLSLCGCGGNAAPAATETPTEAEAPVQVDLQALYETVAQKMPEMILLDEAMMLNFCGIAKEDCAAAVVATCADGLKTDEIWLIEAVDEAALERLQAMAETRLRMKGEESITYSPEQYAVVQKAQTITKGLYLAVVVSPDVEELSEICRNALG